MIPLQTVKIVQAHTITVDASPVDAITVNGPDLYVGGLFTNAAGIENADYIARYDGTNWSSLVVD